MDGDDDPDVLITGLGSEIRKIGEIEFIVGVPVSTLYLNPASGHFILKGVAEQVSGVSLFSMSGKAVRHYPAAKDGGYDTSGLEAGIFFVVIEAGGEQNYAGRLVIRR